MKKLAWSWALLLVACGPSYGGQNVKTPEELVEEQERLGEEQEKESARNDYDTGPDTETDLEKQKKFDKKQADLELKRAARSGETCAGVVSEEGPSGKASVTLVFANDGHVKESSIGAPFADTAIGKCVLNAMKAVIVPAFVGPEETIEWEVEVKAKEEKPEDKKKK
ncbi:MAG: hypothetical protein R3B13_26900 [Polyangiaceae bacterium]